MDKSEYTLPRVKEIYEQAKQAFLARPSAENAAEICNVSGRWFDALYVLKDSDGAVFPEYVHQYFRELGDCLPLMEHAYKEARKTLHNQQEILKRNGQSTEELKGLEKIARSFSQSLQLIRLRKNLIAKHQMGNGDYF